MGCASSACADDQQNASGLRLIASKLHFKDEQLEKLNDYFSELARADRAASEESTRMEARVERLVQRLVAGAASLDRRFAAVFLVSLNEARRVKQRKFEYVLRLDALSTPSASSDAFTSELSLSLEEDSGGSAAGFARLRLRSGDAGSWSEFIGSDGRLRRDLVKSRIATLLAAALRLDVMKNVDERSCITPGQVVEPDILDKLLKQPEHCRIFYGPAEADSDAEKSEHRVVIVEDESGIVLKIGLDGSKSQDIQVRLLIGASIGSWPTSLDYPKRIPLHHCDVLLHYSAAQSGTYAVAVAPHAGLRCEDRTSLWRVRLLAAETGLREHYSRASVPSLTESVLLRIVDQLSGKLSADFALKRKGRLRLVSRHMLRAILWWSLERTGPDPLKSWAPDTLSQHVLLALDELLRSLKCQNLRCYFQPRCNLMLQCVRGGVSHHEDTYAADARLLESYLAALHDYSSEWLREPSPLVPRSLSNSELLDAQLISRWREVLASLPRGSMSAYQGYGQRQLQYLGLVVKEVLLAKEALNPANSGNCSSIFNISMDSQTNESTENLIYLMSLVLQQAKEQVNVSSLGRRKKRNRRRSQAERKRSCAKAYFDKSVDLLLDVVKKDRETAYLDLENHTVMARTLLKWLYFGMEEDKKVLRPLLRPYLGNLFNASHEYAWHVESWRKRHELYTSEMRSLSLFCKLASSREILPANGIVDALSRGWNWADSIARMIERSGNGLGLVFLTPERILRYQLKFADDKGPGSFSTWSKARSSGNALRRANLARTSMIVATDSLPCLLCNDEDDQLRNKDENKVAGHVELRDSSPLTFVAAMARRRGRQRGPGGLIPALVSLNKFRVLQEVAQILPPNERTAMLELVQRAKRETARSRRRASCPDQLNSDVHRQLYTPRSESSLCETPVHYSPESKQQRMIMERQLQLQREILEIHDTLTRGLRSRSQIPTWDSTSMTSWGSMAGSVGRGRLKKHHHRVPVWDTVRGKSPLWDSVSCNSTFVRVKDYPARKSQGSNTELDKDTLTSNRNDKNLDEIQLPSWGALERNLDDKFSTYEYIKSSPSACSNGHTNIHNSGDRRKYALDTVNVKSTKM